jgi:hypothetical protein
MYNYKSDHIHNKQPVQQREGFAGQLHEQGVISKDHWWPWLKISHGTHPRLRILLSSPILKQNARNTAQNDKKHAKHTTKQSKLSHTHKTLPSQFFP